jgi:hypothetical protein
MVFSLRPRAAVISQRMASAWRRSGRTSTGPDRWRRRRGANALRCAGFDVVERLVEHWIGALLLGLGLDHVEAP